MTRDSDTGTEKDTNESIANRKKSDMYRRLNIILENPDAVFISIHLNKFHLSSANGAQVFYSKNNPDSELLASEIQKSVVSALQPENTRQIKESGTDIYLLYHSQVPSVMVECGFMSNEAEAEKLKSDEYQQSMVQAIADGLDNYLKSKPEGETNNGSENKKHFRLQ